MAIKLSAQAKAILKAKTQGTPNFLEATIKRRKVLDGGAVYNDKVKRAAIVRDFTTSNLKNASKGVKVVNGLLVADKKK